MSKQTLLNIAKDSIHQQQKAIGQLENFLNDDFVNVVEGIAQNPGRVVISGIGKSAIIAQKIVATLNSTGTPALFMHAADAIHGDLGMIQKTDWIIIISKSGESPEIKALLPLVKNLGNKVVALCGNSQSYLATHADFFLNSTVEKEACPNNLAPTTSTTAQMVMGDAMAICLLSLKGFTPQDFAKFHPGGALGKQLYLTVGDVMPKDVRPSVELQSSLRDIIISIAEGRMGATAVINADSVLQGIITDGDLRRLLQKQMDVTNVKAADFMSHHPKSIESNALAINALQLMKTNNISQLIVTNTNGTYKGLLHLHDILKEGLV